MKNMRGNFGTTGHVWKTLIAIQTAFVIGIGLSGPVQSEDYQPVSELSFGLMGFSGGTEIGEGGVRILFGEFEKLVLDQEEIVVIEKKVDAGMIATKDYDKIKVSAGTFGSLTVYLTPSQKEAFLKIKAKRKE